MTTGQQRLVMQLSIILFVLMVIWGVFGVWIDKHKLGELRGKPPHVTYDTINKLLGIVGGEYTILPEGIDN